MNDIGTPNLLFVFSDQHRAADLGCYGNGQVRSPRFDAFAREAALFTRCVSNSPVCVPARGTLLTGLYPVKHKAVSNDMPIDPKMDSIAHVMNRHGYRTGYIGKWHLGGIPRYKPIKQKERLGFDEWKAANCTHDYLNSYYYDEQDEWHEIIGYEPATQTDLALDFLERHKDGDSPWGLVLSWGPPHAPHDQVPREYRDIYENTDIELRPNVEDKILQRIGDYCTSDEMKERLKGYYAHITALDEQFGRLLDKLEETGQLENTVVVYTSDHGDMLGSQGQTKKQWWYSESINVPLMVYWKGRTRPVKSEELISLVDLPVSLMSLMGIPFEARMDGQDLSRLFIDEEAKGAEECYIMDLISCHQAYWRGSTEWRGLVTDRHTYVIDTEGREIALYDNREDPYQRNNLKDDRSKALVKVELKDRLMKLIKDHDALLPQKAFLEKFDLTEEWNRSQRHFGLPEVD